MSLRDVERRKGERPHFSVVQQALPAVPQTGTEPHLATTTHSPSTLFTPTLFTPTRAATSPEPPSGFHFVVAMPFLERHPLHRFLLRRHGYPAMRPRRATTSAQLGAEAASFIQGGPTQFTLPPASLRQVAPHSTICLGVFFRVATSHPC